MNSFILVVSLFIATVSATSPIKNETEDSVVPTSKPVESVPQKCPENEVLKLRYLCPPDSCDTLYLQFLCVAEQSKSLVCTCKDGYRRSNSSATGVCVPQDRCLPPECADDPNAIRGCGNRCKKTCADYNDKNKVCNKKLVCKLFGCDCRDGLVYDEIIKKCVEPKKCTKQCKKPHERYSSCLLGECVAKTCDQLGLPIACPGIVGPCEGGCICEEGYVRDCNGNCIEKKKCPCCGDDPNAVSGCGNPCGKTCASLYANNSDLVCPQYCEYNGCDCKPGYRLLSPDNTGSKKCIPERECPKPPQRCGENEQYYCGTSCPEATCANTKPPTCVNKKCKLACFCKKGFVRNANNKCVPVDKCPSVCKDPNASWTDCRDACPATCQNTRPACVNKMCSPGCQCNEGYVLSKEGGKCVKIETCADYVDCGGNQTFVYCTHRCPQVECPQSDQTLLCKPPRDCPGGCGCKPYYRYNATGDCIKGSDCPPVECTRLNEEWAPCRSEYDWERCDDRFNSPPIIQSDPDDCNPRCVCKKGFWKNNSYECVPESECPPLNG